MKYGDWEVIRDAGRDKSGIPISECKCKCGLVKFVQTNSLKRGNSKCFSCKKKDSMQKKYIGKRFFKLIVIDQLPGKRCVCECDCGVKKIFRTNALVSGQSKSCGCIISINRNSYNEHAKEKLISSIKINESGCWVWQKSKHKQGYGNFGYKRKVLLAHRVSWMLFNGEISADVLVLHKCDNPPCCNPDHLFLGTHRDNIEDAFKKGRVKRKHHNNYKLNKENIKEIILMHINGCSTKEIYKKFNICREHASAIIKRRVWKNID